MATVIASGCEYLVFVDIPIVLEDAGLLAAFTHPNHLLLVGSWGFAQLPPTCISNSNGYRASGVETVLKRKKLAKIASLVFCLSLPSRTLLYIGMLSFLVLVASFPTEVHAAGIGKPVLMLIGGSFTLIMLSSWYDNNWRSYIEFSYHFPDYAIQYEMESDRSQFKTRAHALKPSRLIPLNSAMFTIDEIRLGRKHWDECINRVSQWEHYSTDGLDFHRLHMHILGGCLLLAEKERISQCYSLILDKALKPDGSFLRSTTGSSVQRADWVSPIGEKNSLYPVFRMTVTDTGKEDLQLLEWIPMYSGDAAEEKCGSMLLIGRPEEN